MDLLEHADHALHVFVGMTSDTALSGMPLSKNIEVEVEPLGESGADG